MPLLKRKYKLTIGLPKIVTITSRQVVEDEVFGNSFIPKEYDYRTVKLNAVEITDLDIEAKIVSTTSSGGKSNTTLSIYNMSEETREIVERVNNYVILEAGYASDPELKVIFTGQVSGFSTRNQGEGLVTQLVCKDGYIPQNTLRVDKTFPEGTKLNKIFQYIIKQYNNSGIPLGNFVSAVDEAFRVNYVQIQAPDNIEFPMGYSLVGYLSDSLQDLCESVGYVNYITNGKLFIEPAHYTKTSEKFIVKHDNIFSIKPAASTPNSSPVGKKDTGVLVTMQLDGRLDVDKQLQIEGGKYAGTYRIQSKTFDLGYRNGAWDITVTCKRVDS